MKTKYLIFIVDDDRFNLISVSRKLRKNLNCSIRLFRNASDCIRKSVKETPDVILINYRLKGEKNQQIQGDYLLSWAKKNYSTTPVIMFSTSRSFELAVKLVRKGAAEFVVRDSNFLDKICVKVREHLIRKSNRGEQKITKGQILLTMIIVVSTMLYLGAVRQEMLKVFSVIVLAVFAIIHILREPLKRYVY